MRMRFDDVLQVLDDVPDYQTFLTVDELKASAQRLAERFPEIVQLLPVGRSRLGDPIEALKIGHGEKRALVFAMPHPNEPIGSMMLEYLSARLAEDDGLRETLGYTWYFIKCIDPDGTRLNEGWFKGPFSITNYARNYYRPPSFQQVEWTFPVDYKTLHFHDPLPETRALMTLIEQVRLDLLYSLHNSGFGGVYFYLSREAPPLYEPFYEVVKSQDLPLHLGEPEISFAIEYSKAIYNLPPISRMYDFYEEHTGTDPAQFMSGGASSVEYALRFCDPLFLVCEMPYFYNWAIYDTSPSDMVRREALLQGIDQAKEHVAFLKGQYQAVEGELTMPSPFRASIQESLRTFEQRITAQENWARTDPRTAQPATVAEKFDNLVLAGFYRLLSLGMFVRMLETQIAETGESPVLSAAREQAEAAFAARSAALEVDLAYTVIPIQKLVRVQLGSALLAAGYASGD